MYKKSDKTETDSRLCLPELVTICHLPEMHFYDLLRFRVTLTFYLLTPKVDRFISL